MLEHVLGQKYGEIFPRHVLVVLAKTKNRDFCLRQNKTTILTSKGGQIFCTYSREVGREMPGRGRA